MDCKSNGPGGNVIVDMKGVNPADYQRDLNECQTYAQQVDTTGKVGGNAAGGAVVGGAIGGIFGGAEGAARGAGAGAVTGGAAVSEQTRRRTPPGGRELSAPPRLYDLN